MKIDSNMEIIYGNGRITIICKHNLLREYEKKVLASAMITGLAVVEFLRTDQIDRLTYNISGMKKISESNFSRLNDAFELFKKILTILLNADEYLIDIDKINLDYDSIYEDERKNNIRLLYLPSVEKVPWQTSLSGLINEIKISYNRQDLTNYLEQLNSYLSMSHRTIEDVLNKISELKREAHLCGILFDR